MPAELTLRDRERRRRSFRWRRRFVAFSIYRLAAAGPSYSPDNFVLARQPYVRSCHLDRLHSHAALSEHEGSCRAWQGFVDGRGAGEDGGFHPHYTAVASLSGAY